MTSPARNRSVRSDFILNLVHQNFEEEQKQEVKPKALQQQKPEMNSEIKSQMNSEFEHQIVTEDIPDLISKLEPECISELIPDLNSDTEPDLISKGSISKIISEHCNLILEESKSEAISMVNPDLKPRFKSEIVELRVKASAEQGSGETKPQPELFGQKPVISLSSSAAKSDLNVEIPFTDYSAVYKSKISGISHIKTLPFIIT